MENFPKKEASLTEKQMKRVEGYISDFGLDSSDLEKPILDVGCGSGDFISYIRDVLGNEKSFGLERDDTKIPAEANGVVIGSVSDIPFIEDEFEIVLAHNFIPMFFGGKNFGENLNVSDVISNMLKVLKSGGVLKFDAPTPEIEKENNDIFKIEHPDIVNDKVIENMSRRVVGAGEMMEFLENLSKQGYLVENLKYNGKTNVFSVKKP